MKKRDSPVAGKSRPDHLFLVNGRQVGPVSGANSDRGGQLRESENATGSGWQLEQSSRTGNFRFQIARSLSLAAPWPLSLQHGNAETQLFKDCSSKHTSWESGRRNLLLWAIFAGATMSSHYTTFADGFRCCGQRVGSLHSREEQALAPSVLRGPMASFRTSGEGSSVRAQVGRRCLAKQGRSEQPSRPPACRRNLSPGSWLNVSFHLGSRDMESCPPTSTTFSPVQPPHTMEKPGKGQR